MIRRLNHAGWPGRPFRLQRRISDLALGGIIAALVSAVWLSAGAAGIAEATGGVAGCAAGAGTITSATGCLGQTITFNALTNATFGDAPFTVSASATSGLTVTFSSTTTPVCTVSGSTVTLRSVGTCTIQADQAGNGTYDVAPSVLQSFTVNAFPVPGGVATFSSSAGGVFSNLTNTAVVASSAPPAGVTFPYGLIGFTISGLTAGASTTVTLTLPGPVAQYWKFQNGVWHKVSGATFSGNVITITLVDGGPDDADGTANGTIVDPGAPATVLVAAFTG